MCNTEAVRRIAYAGIVLITVRGSNITRIVLPGSRAHDMRHGVVICPWRFIRRCPLIILMPTIGHPLMDIAAHIIKAEGVRFETADLPGLRGVVGLIAAQKRMDAPSWLFPGYRMRWRWCPAARSDFRRGWSAAAAPYPPRPPPPSSPPSPLPTP